MSKCNHFVPKLSLVNYNYTTGYVVMWYGHTCTPTHIHCTVVGIDVRAFILANTLGSFNVIKSQGWGKTKVGKTNRWYTAATTALKSELHSPDSPSRIHDLNYEIFNTVCTLYSLLHQ